MAELLALLASVGWGIGDFLGGYASRNNGFWAVNLQRQALATVVIVPLAIIFGGSPSAGDLGWAFIAGMSASIVMPLFFKALSEGHMATVAPVAATVGAVVPVAVGVALGEDPSTAQKTGAALAIVAIALISVGGAANLADIRRAMLHSDVLYGIGCGLGFAGFFVAMHQTSDDSGLWPAMVTTATAVAVALAASRHSKTSLGVRREDRTMIWLGSLFNLGAIVTYMLAAREGLLSIASVLSSLYPAVTVLLAALVLKERMTLVHTAGFAVGIAGIGLIAAG